MDDIRLRSVRWIAMVPDILCRVEGSAYSSQQAPAQAAGNMPRPVNSSTVLHVGYTECATGVSAVRAKSRTFASSLPVPLEKVSAAAVANHAAQWPYHPLVSTHKVPVHMFMPRVPDNTHGVWYCASEEWPPGIDARERD